MRLANPLQMIFYMGTLNTNLQSIGQLNVWNEKRAELTHFLATSETDRFGLVRSLFLGDGAAHASLDFFRTLGLVHVATLSGFHLVILFGYSAWWAEIYFSRPGARRWTHRFFLLGFLGLFLFVWSFSHFRYGLLRPVFTLGLKRMSGFFGYPISGFGALLAGMGIDFLHTLICNPQVDWISDGSLHYYCAVGGGLYGYQIAKKFRLSVHGSVAWFSWLSTIPLSFMGPPAPISFWTPVLSLLTVPVISLIIFPVLLGGLLLATFDFSSGYFLLSWGSALYSEFIKAIAQMVLGLGEGIRSRAII